VAKSLKHKIHKYRRATLGKSTIYNCIIPGCSHYLYPERVVNRISLCNKCEKEFVMPSRVGLLRSIPICPDCSNVDVLDPAIEQTIDKLLKVG
jgi:hypothetical protein